MGKRLKRKISKKSLSVGGRPLLRWSRRSTGKKCSKGSNEEDICDCCQGAYRVTEDECPIYRIKDGYGHIVCPVCGSSDMAHNPNHPSPYHQIGDDYGNKKNLPCGNPGSGRTHRRRDLLLKRKDIKEMEATEAAIKEMEATEAAIKEMEETKEPLDKLNGWTYSQKDGVWILKNENTGEEKELLVECRLAQQAQVSAGDVNRASESEGVYDGQNKKFKCKEVQTQPAGEMDPLGSSASATKTDTPGPPIEGGNQDKTSNKKRKVRKKIQKKSRRSSLLKKVKKTRSKK